MMKPFKVHKKIIRGVKAGYPCPKVSPEWLRSTTRDTVEEHGHQADVDVPALIQAVSDAIEQSSFKDIAEPGTGIPKGVTEPKVHTLLQKAMVLELVHLTEVGISAMTLEGVRQEREHRIYLDRVAHSSSSQQGLTLREFNWLRPDLTPYPQRRLKLFLSDGTKELQAIEFEPLPNITLGVTSMGTKIHLKNVQIIGGIAYLRRENVMIIGGAVASLQAMHQLRLYEEFCRHMNEEETEAEGEGVSPEELYFESSLPNIEDEWR